MRRLTLGLLLCSILAAPALADPYGQATVKYIRVGPAQMIQINDTRAGVGISNLNVYSCVSEIQVSGYSDYATNPVAVPGGGAQFDGVGRAAFCIDVTDNVDIADEYRVNVTPLGESPDPSAGPMNSEKASQLAWLLDNNSWSLTMDTSDAAAMQLAVWEIVNEVQDSSYNVATGNFYANAGSNTSAQAGAQSLLNEMVANWISGYSHAGYVGLSSPVALGDTEYQDFVVNVVPLPGAVLLGLLGLGAAGMRLRRMVA